MHPSRTPVILGSGQFRGPRHVPLDSAREPLALVLDAVRAAAGPDVLRLVDAVYTVGVASWDYDELSARVATAIGAQPRHRVDTPIGGHLPVRLLAQAAARIAAGESQVALVVGGEAEATVADLRKAGTDPQAELGWTPRGTPAAFDLAAFGGPEQVAAGLLIPTRVYPLFENRLQADLGQTPAQAATWTAEIYAALSRVAAAHPCAWTPVERTPAEIATVSAENRMICEPYPLLVNANPRTDQAAALVVTSLEAALAAGVPADSLTYLWGGRGVDAPVDLLRRPAYGASAALEQCLTNTAAVAGGLPDLIDVYSCFPVVPKLASQVLGTGRDRVLSVAGGHSAFGGPLNTYSLHAVATAHEQLRGTTRTGLVHANGGYLTYHHGVVLAGRPSPQGWDGDPAPVTLAPEGRVAPVEPCDAVIETCTVEHAREGGPKAAYAIGRTESGERVVARTKEPAVAAGLSLSALAPGVSTHVGRRLRLGVADGAHRIDAVL